MPNFKEFRSLKGFTQEELVRLKEHCFQKKIEVNTHFFYNGIDKDNYSQVTLNFRGVQYQFYRHQLSLFLKLKEQNIDWDDELCTSHRCHKKRCCNPAHLILESSENNMSRVMCQHHGRCFGHGNGVPQCLI